jgi:gliding motility-associated-like protein
MIDLNGDCTEQESFSVQINKSPNAGTDNLTASSCISETDFDLTTLLGVNTDTNGTWSPALTSGTNIFSPEDDGANTYTYTVTGTLPCADSVAVLTITIVNPGNPLVSDQSFCLIDAPTVADLVATGTSLAWYDNENSTTPLLNTDSLVDGEDYWVTQSNGCESLKFSMIATINDPGIPVLETNGNQFCVIDNPTIADLETQIINDNNYSIIWYDSLTDGNTINQNTSLIEGETYYASFSNQSNLCASADRLPITANLTNCDDEDFVIPEAFSPNGDGQNDTFSISNIGVLYPNYSIEIYNRYGNVVHKGNINTSDFDGKSNQNSFITNDVLPVGVYFYIIEFNNNAKKPIQGYLYLSR